VPYDHAARRTDHRVPPDRDPAPDRDAVRRPGTVPPGASSGKPAGTASGRGDVPAGTASSQVTGAERAGHQPGRPPSEAAAVRRMSSLAGVADRLRGSIPVRCVGRFMAIGGRDRVLALAGQAFTTLIPLLIIVAAVSTGPGSATLSDRLVERFHLTGQAADAVRTLFSRPPTAGGAITLAGVVVLLAALVSLTRSLQRTYEAAWGLPPPGLRGKLTGLGGMGLLLAELIVLSLVAGVFRQVPAGSVLNVVLRGAVAAAVWVLLQDLLLAHRVPRRQLLPGAVVASIGQVVVSFYSALWMPRLVSSNAERYGVIGVTFALLAWLIVIGFTVVAAAVVSAEIGGARRPDLATADGEP
jgi:membrane protein